MDHLQVAALQAERYRLEPVDAVCECRVVLAAEHTGRSSAANIQQDAAYMHQMLVGAQAG